MVTVVVFTSLFVIAAILIAGFYLYLNNRRWN